MQFGIDTCTAGDQVELVYIASVEPGAFDTDFTVTDLQLAEAAVIDLWCSGRQRDPWGIDKTATIAADAVRVSDHHMGLLACDFGVTLELARVAASDFIKDQVGGLAIQVGVAKDDPCLLGADEFIGAVVKNQPLGGRRCSR